MECLLETKAATILEFIQGWRGTLSRTFEEGTSAAWLHDLLQPHVSRLVVCDPRKASLLKDGNKSDRMDARKLAELLRTNQVKPVKSLYRSWAIPCSGTTIYAPLHRAEWLAKIVEPGVRVRAEHLYEQLDSVPHYRRQARRELLVESHKHAALNLLRQIPSIGPIRGALLVALLQTPHRVGDGRSPAVQKFAVGHLLVFRCFFYARISFGRWGSTDGQPALLVQPLRAAVCYYDKHPTACEAFADS